MTMHLTCNGIAQEVPHRHQLQLDAVWYGDSPFVDAYPSCMHWQCPASRSVMPFCLLLFSNLR